MEYHHSLKRQFFFKGKGIGAEFFLEILLNICYYLYMNRAISKDLQGILWSKNVDKLDLRKDKNYIIHNILMYGNLSDIKRLFELYSPDVVRSVFVSSPKKIYTKPIFGLIKNFVLDIRDIRLNEEKYIKTLH